MIPTYDVAMLGPSGVGKTSLLSAIYAEFFPGIPGTELHVRSVPSSKAWLQERRAELQRICQSPRVTEVGIRGAVAARSIELSLGRPDSPEDDGHLRLRFTDHPGGWIFSDQDPPDQRGYEQLRERFQRSRVLIVVVDTPALMYREGLYHHDVNRPLQAAEETLDWLHSGEKASILIAPVKCEAWIAPDNPDDGLGLLRTAIESRYSELLQQIRKAGPVPTWLTPVRTVGGLVHDGYRKDQDGTLSSRFRGAVAKPRYAPAWGGEVMRHVVVASIDQRVNERGWWEELMTFFGHHKDIESAVTQMRKQSFGPSDQLIVP